MTTKEMVTDFRLEGAAIRDLMTAINEHLTRCGIEPEDRGFSVSCTLEDWQSRGSAKVPDDRTYRWLVAFAVEGESEGYYIHIGAITRQDSRHEPGPKFLDFGHAKCYSAEQAYQIATEAQRFLTAARWN